ncbi:methyltransferase family protein [Jatrophihabitans sp. GAS493]|uniref:methyltransferase domain-containing protein n=1 Tax=Jatrophihabitans sp. GAS493 TaxID=1907575 RepID=UPI000BB6B1AE|nr:methyltransferase domain-containing protein [Jatrophihabitans sp. GAS493]SOD75032.1 methyltransferase family protein [Jatrophihabitans sp. GAS493]
MTGYSLQLNGSERERFRVLARMAALDEAADWSSAGIVEGARIADVGCGPGATLRLLAERVGPTGRVVGVDADPRSVEVANAVVAAMPQASVCNGRADATGLTPATFDVAMCRLVLTHNGGREAAIVSHLASLVRSGGCVYLADTDISSSWVTDPVFTEMADRFSDFHTACGNDVSVGRKLGDLIEAAGLSVERYRTTGHVRRVPPGTRGPVWAAKDAMLAAGVIDASDVERYEARFNRIEESGIRPWAFMPVFVAVGRRDA